MYGCMYLASKIAVNTTLAASAGGISVLLFDTIIGNPSDIKGILNGILSGISAYWQHQRYCVTAYRASISRLQSRCHLMPSSQQCLQFCKTV